MISSIKCLFATALMLAASQAVAQQAWLMTYGTAERVEEQFGHNAIWIRDPARGIDKVYNFGFFDFDKPGFYREYLFGEMIYYALARSPEEELAYYRWRDRDVRAQLLNLDTPTIRELTEWLEARVQPETRNFRYDYYFNNCSNRVRDALDHALDGALHRYAVDRPARLNFRAHTRRLIQDDPLLYIGIQSGLGRPADRPRSRWEEMFLPSVVAETVGRMRLPGEGSGAEPLVLADRMLYRSTRPEPPASPAFNGHWFAGLAVATLVLVALPSRVFRRRTARLAGARAWIALTTAAGGLLLFLWLATAHEAAWRNENLLLFNPLAAILWRFRGGAAERAAASTIAAGLALALLLKLFPGAQWNYDLLLWLVPAQSVLLWLWWKEGAPPTAPRIAPAQGCSEVP